MSYEMTPLCGFGMEAPGSVSVVVPDRHLQTVNSNNGATITVDEAGSDWMLIISAPSAMLVQTIALPQTGANLQVGRIASMQDVATLNFTGGTVLNAPMELLANQSVTIQRINATSKTWITI